MPNSGRIGLYHLAAKKEEDDIWIREGGKKNDLSDRLKKSHFKAASRFKREFNGKEWKIRNTSKNNFR